MKENEIIAWWDKLPVNERIFLKNKWMPECKHLVNVKADHLINSGCYQSMTKNDNEKYKQSKG